MGAIVASYVTVAPTDPRAPSAVRRRLPAALLRRGRDRLRRRGRRGRRTVARQRHARRGGPPVAASGRVTAPARRACRPPSARPRSSTRPAALLGGQLPRHDDGRDRARGGRHRADPLPALRVEARPLPRLPRRVLARAPRALGRGVARRSPIRRCWVARDRHGVLRGHAIRGSISPNLWIQALDRGERRPGDPQVPPEAHARGARLRRRRHPPRPGGRRDPRGPRPERRGVDLPRRSACSGRSAAALGGLVDEDFDAIVASRRQLDDRRSRSSRPRRSQARSPNHARSTASAARRSAFRRESQLSAKPGCVTRTKGKPPAAAPGASIWRRSPTLARPAR